MPARLLPDVDLMFPLNSAAASAAGAAGAVATAATAAPFALAAFAAFAASPPDREPQTGPKEISTGPVTAVEFASINVEIRTELEKRVFYAL